MNDCGRSGIPFLFALNFELTEGVVLENPLGDAEAGTALGKCEEGLRFQVGRFGNLPVAPAGASLPPLPPLPPDGWRVADGDGAAYARAFSQVQ
ncbi:MAG: hypothetical protein K2O01_06485, partial [Bacteroidales bacterium]|nr:hypothetical protein [Bacteroidales bacterium]